MTVGSNSSSSSSNAQAVRVGCIFGMKRHAAHIADNLGAAAQARTFQKQDSKRVAVLEVESHEALEAVPFHMQGDAALSSPEAFKKRKKLKRDVAVVAQLSRWWDAAIATARMSHPGTTTLSYRDYSVIYHRVSMRLLEDSYDADEAEVEAQEEWAKDSLSSNSSKLSQRGRENHYHLLAFCSYQSLTQVLCMYACSGTCSVHQHDV